MKRRGLSLVLPLLALLVGVLPARAGESWCFSDPIVRLNGTRIQILVGIPEGYQPLVNGPIEVEIKTPDGTTRELILTDAGFNGHGEVVRFGDLDDDEARGAKAFTTKIKVRVPIDKRRLAPHTQVPVRVDITPENAAPVVVVGTSADTTASLTIKSTKIKKGN